MCDNLTAAVLVIGGTIGVVGLLWALRTSMQNHRDATTRYGEYLELSREGQRLQTEANELMRELIAALRDKR
jgi:hypothetical protein